MAMMTSWVMPVNPSHPYLENDPAPSFAPTICAFHLGFSLVPFPLEYALYRKSVSTARHSRASGNPELEVTFQYRQDHLETVLVVQLF